MAAREGNAAPLPDRLRGAGLSPSAIEHSLSVLRWYEQQWRETLAADGPCEDDERERARVVWQRLVAARRWTAVYAQRARTSLLRALALAAPIQAQGLRANAPGRNKRVFTQSSHETQFLLHDCLPREVRQLPARNLRYRLLSYVVERLVEHLKSACRRSLQKKMNFVHCVLYADPPLVGSAEEEGPLQDALARLKGIPAASWLDRLSVAYPGDEGCINGKLFRSHLNLLNLLHHKVFQCVDRASTTIPVTTGLTVCAAAYTTATDSEGSSFSTFADGGARRIPRRTPPGGCSSRCAGSRCASASGPAWIARGGAPSPPRRSWPSWTTPCPTRSGSSSTS